MSTFECVRLTACSLLLLSACTHDSGSVMASSNVGATGSAAPAVEIDTAAAHADAGVAPLARADAGMAEPAKSEAGSTATRALDAGRMTASAGRDATVATTMDAAVPDAQADAAPKLSGTYVAMGSSYAAGPSIPDTMPGLCARSTHNYAHLVATDLGMTLDDVSCSGATSDNVAMVAQLGNPLQIAAVTADTRLVTITIGGNDVDYASSLSTCGSDGSQGRSCLTSGDVNRDTVSGLLNAVEGKLTTMLKKIQSAGPNARVYLVGYPMVLPDPATPCPPDVPMQAGDAEFLGQMGAKLQAAFVAAAAAAGVHFVDVYTASRGHDACAPEDQRWIVGQATPGATAYHPTALGMSAQADLIVDEINRGP